MKLLSRIEKIEATLRESTTGAVLLREPPENASADEWETFGKLVSLALEAGQRVIVRASGASAFRRIRGAIYEPEDFSALLALLACSPADDGHSQDKLSQIVNGVQGSTLPVVHEAAP